MSEPTITVVPDPDTLADHAADRFVTLCADAIRTHGSAAVALAGGSTPRAMNARLAAEPRRSRLDWTSVRFFFGDERCVPPDDPDSNYGMTRETLFEPLGIPEANVERMRGEDEPQAAAAAYHDLLVKTLGARPVLDVMFLGMGPDGHTASLFPGTLDAIEVGRLAVANFVPKFDTYRITLTPTVINAARHVTVTVAGAEKAAALAAVMAGPRNPQRYPAQLVAPTDGELTWLIDAPAAAQLNLPVS
jgi:6-phosphogluconolactonase